MTTTGWAISQRRPPSERIPGKAALRLVAGFEGLVLRAYPDPASPRGRELAKKPEKRVAGWETLSPNPWTIGYGHTGPEVHEGLTCTLAEADAWLQEDLNEAADIVRSQIIVPLTQGEFDALCSLAYNLGYIPKSMKACLNGGVTDKGVEMAAGSYGSALQQFPRNCRAAGIPLRGLLRRRLAEACVYSDLPWESACSENLVQLELDKKGDPDPVLTTSLEDTLQRARQDVPILRPDVSDVLKAPWPTAKEQAAAPEASTEAKEGGAASPQPTPSPSSPAEQVQQRSVESPVAAGPAPQDPPILPLPGEGKPVAPASNSVSRQSSGEAEPAGAGRTAEGPSPPLAPTITKPLPPKPPPVIAPKQIDMRNGVPYGEIPPDGKPKNMTDSARVIGLVIVGIGSIVQVLSAREIISTTIGAVFYDLSRDSAFVAMAAGAGAMLVGWATRKRGTHIVAKGMVNATALLK